MEQGDVRQYCPCGGYVVRWEAVLGCRSCGTVYAMFLSMETRSPAKYQPPPELAGAPTESPGRAASAASTRVQARL